MPEFRKQSDLFKAAFQRLAAVKTIEIRRHSAVDGHYYLLTDAEDHVFAPGYFEETSQKDAKQDIRDRLFQGSIVFVSVDRRSGNYLIDSIARSYL
jgi:hypothetical protein